MKPLHLFNAFGLELEYMIVDKDTLAVRPISDRLLADDSGITGDVVRGEVTWSNELATHVIELKTTRPVERMSLFDGHVHHDVKFINQQLNRYNAMLLPTAMHPFMDPYSEMHLWPHDYSEVYEAYNTLFNCKGHGWANVQSTHLNLPFFGDDEFRSLHSAVRILLPLLPAICASSPMVDAKLSGYADTRLEFYKTNQNSVPSFSGKIIPEVVLSRRDYEEKIYQPVYTDIRRLGQDEILDPVWVNSRGAIARFDRGSIEIRLMDVQECPKADIAIATFVAEILLGIVEGELLLRDHMNFSTDVLAAILDQTIRHGEHAIISDRDYLGLFDISAPVKVSELLMKLFEQIAREKGSYFPTMRTLLKVGTLSSRIVRALGDDPAAEDIDRVYRSLAQCLDHNQLYLP
jgi:gamma-glutamyl:cysteine ligase YbdK (ATP-grasp superfamily)